MYPMTPEPLEVRVGSMTSISMSIKYEIQGRDCGLAEVEETCLHDMGYICTANVEASLAPTDPVQVQAAGFPQTSHARQVVAADMKTSYVESWYRLIEASLASNARLFFRRPATGCLPFGVLAIGLSTVTNLPAISTAI
ncbi:uncharacterized protein GIQ15_03157 [Arthroderma uncinatum]|uniref:uncharacterized protein n=1 Tax=Arthroderma uncinatum TaxID=74035 RepID=UPI00144AE0B5|nr:uncharacterized protein GIQ15_03157 [Arthroderma uncinatum]KAF3483833.1 hypothetical protein GIQ15_03157 [Arthroderma uncinatum]